MLRECLRHEPLAKIVLAPNLLFKFFDYVESSTFDIASDAFSSFKVLHHFLIGPNIISKPTCLAAAMLSRLYSNTDHLTFPLSERPLPSKFLLTLLVLSLIFILFHRLIPVSVLEIKYILIYCRMFPWKVTSIYSICRIYLPDTKLLWKNVWVRTMTCSLKSIQSCWILRTMSPEDSHWKWDISHTVFFIVFGKLSFNSMKWIKIIVYDLLKATWWFFQVQYARPRETRLCVNPIGMSCSTVYQETILWKQSWYMGNGPIDM